MADQPLEGFASAQAPLEVPGQGGEMAETAAAGTELHQPCGLRPAAQSPVDERLEHRADVVVTATTGSSASTSDAD